MTSVGGEGSTKGNDGVQRSSTDETNANIKTNNGEASNDGVRNYCSVSESKPSSGGSPFSSVPQVFGMGTGNREGLRLSLENSLGSSGGSAKSSSLMLTTPTFTSSNLSPGSLLLPPTLLTPGTLNLLNTPTSSSVLGLVASSPAGAPTLTTPTLTPTTLRNIEQMFLEHDELGAGFGGSHSSESHENAAHFVPPPVAADELSRSLKEDVTIKEEPLVTSASASNAPIDGMKCFIILFFVISSKFYLWGELIYLFEFTLISDDSQKIDAAEVLNSIAQLTPNARNNLTPKPPTTTLARPASLSLSMAANLLGPINPTHVPPPLTTLKPANGIQDNICKPEAALRMGSKQTEIGTTSVEPILTIPSLTKASTSSIATKIAAPSSDDRNGMALPTIRVPPALPTITISLPSTTQLVKQELPQPGSVEDKIPMPPLASIVGNLEQQRTTHQFSSLPLHEPKDLSKKSSSLRPTTLNIPKPLSVPTILLPKESLTATDSSLLSLANVSAVQNHLPVLPPPTRPHIQGVNPVNCNPNGNSVSGGGSNCGNITNTNLVPSSSISISSSALVLPMVVPPTLHKPSNAKHCAIIPSSTSLTTTTVSGLPAGLTITANKIIKQEIPIEDIIHTTNVNQDASNHTSSVIQSNVNGNLQQPSQARQNKRKPGKIKPVVANNLSIDIKNGPHNKSKESNNGEHLEEDDDSAPSDNLDLSGLSNEERRKVLRRQRNKEAAARCRKRRLDQTLGLQEQVDQWVESRNELQREINELQNQETELQNMLNLHQLTNCKLNKDNKLIKNSIVTTVLERDPAPIIGGGLGRLAAVAAAVSNSMKMAKEVEEESSINLSTTTMERPIKMMTTMPSSTSTNKKSGDRL